MHTTNYVDTLITVAPDTKAHVAVSPPQGKGSVAERQFTLLSGHEYELTSDDVIFTVFADRHDIAVDERDAARALFFTKGQPCLRTSPLAKSYGWGIHSDAQGCVALVGVGSERYQALLADTAVAKKAAMKSSR